MSESCKGNRLCQIRRIRYTNSVVDPIFVAGSSSNFYPLFSRNKAQNNINSYIEIKDPLTTRSPNERRDSNYGELIDPLFREYFDNVNNKIEYYCYYRWVGVILFAFILFLMFYKNR
jgi:hypothetical protein